MKLATWFPAALSPFNNNTQQSVLSGPATRSSDVFTHAVLCVFPSEVVLAAGGFNK